ncbi:haloacid dehalogenase-like hydrolase domain-containing protein Sgpp isoform X2 [Cajanus cajan]|uniref:haloacid dehalogenase-like hydrolase domain-containing protein Sgpp isoform X2 n=1 Tax=Cajanus cajan TaxID=3821 RepID=UPI00098DAEFF|nr:haloacid dehalogenase-like hydrolase domain-containing protein Sgpp isoform X2 [Cajanus cajan]
MSLKQRMVASEIHFGRFDKYYASSREVKLCPPQIHLACVKTNFKQTVTKACSQNCVERCLHHLQRCLFYSSWEKFSNFKNKGKRGWILCPNKSMSSLTRLAPLEAVLFDVDGTLCDSDPLHYYALREMLQQIGFNGGAPITEEYFIETFSGKHSDDTALIVFPGDLERGLKFVEDKEDMFRRVAADQLNPLKGLDKVRKWVENHGLKRAAVTNAPRANAELMISKLGLLDFFDAVIIGDECEHAKPHPDPYLKALEVLKASKDHAFVFEDSVSGIKAGVAAGMPVIGLATRNPEHLLMEAKPAFLIKDYEDPKLWAALEELDKAGAR